MIDDIVEMILKEAGKGSRWDRFSNIVTVKNLLIKRLNKILDDIQEEEEGEKEDENKG